MSDHDLQASIPRQPTSAVMGGNGIWVRIIPAVEFEDVRPCDLVAISLGEA